jgi:(2Fe-2S) ferredoxin
VVVYPEGYWYTKVTLEDVPEIFQKSVLGDEPLERLLAGEETWQRLDEIRGRQ